MTLTRYSKHTHTPHSKSTNKTACDKKALVSSNSGDTSDTAIDTPKARLALPPFALNDRPDLYVSSADDDQAHQSSKRPASLIAIPSMVLQPERTTHANRKRKRREEHNDLVSRLDMALPDEARTKGFKVFCFSCISCIDHPDHEDALVSWLPRWNDRRVSNTQWSGLKHLLSGSISPASVSAHSQSCTHVK
jgi:hypothetical protein